jgi:putative FmdB family regulatory protein
MRLDRHTARTMGWMPTYEYRCMACGNRFDVFQRIDEEPLRECRRCGGELRKVFHPAGIVFKGSGFYATDSRAASTSASKDGDGGGKGEGKKPAKPAEGARKAEGSSESRPPDKKPAADASS